MSIEALGLEGDFDFDIFGATPTHGTLEGRPVRKVDAGVWFKDVTIGKVAASYSLRGRYVCAKVDDKEQQAEKQKEPEKKSSGGIGISVEAKKETNGDSKAHVDVRIEKKTEGGGNVTVSAGGGIQKDSKGKVSNEQHAKVDIYYPF